MRPGWLAVAVTLLASISAAAAGQEKLQDRFVSVGGEAFGLLPAELVCGPRVTEAKWSPDGKHILSVCRSERISPELAKARALSRDQKEPPGDLSIVVWSREEHRSHEVWRRPLSKAAVEEIRWLPASDRAVAIVNETISTAQGPRRVRQVLWMRADAETARLVAEIPFDWRPPGWVTSPLNYLEISPSKPLALIVRWTIEVIRQPNPNGAAREYHQYQYDLTPIGEDGRARPNFHLPVDAIPALWSEDGSRLYWQHVDRPADPKQKRTFTYFEFDPRTGSLVQLPGEPTDYRKLLEMRHPRPAQRAEAETGPIRVTAGEADLPDKVRPARLHPLWMEVAGSSGARVLVCPDATWSILAPGRDAALFFSYGAAWVRPILRVSALDYQAMLREEARRQAVADAETLAGALKNQVQDREYYPKLDQLNEWLGPYLTDKSLLNSLIYTYAGGLPPKDPEDWPTTQMGYVKGPGGRAIIFADGHAAWKDD